MRTCPNCNELTSYDSATCGNCLTIDSAWQEALHIEFRDRGLAKPSSIRITRDIGTQGSSNTSRGTTYELMVPEYRTIDIDVEAGDEITVEGILVDGRFEDEEPMLMVTKAIIDGEEYIVSHPYGMMGRDRMGGFARGDFDDERWPQSRGGMGRRR